MQLAIAGSGLAARLGVMVSYQATSAFRVPVL